MRSISVSIMTLVVVSTFSIVAASTVSTGYEQLRVGVFHEDFLNPSRYCTAVGQQRPTYDGKQAVCTEADVWTDEAIQTFFTQVVPQAADLHAQRLLVERTTIPPVFFFLKCGTFTVPSNQSSKSTTEYDLLLYFASGATSGKSSGQWCIKNTAARPVVGAITTVPALAENTYQNVRLTARNIAFSLGFEYTTYLLADMTDSVQIFGRTVFRVVSPKVKAWTQQFYDCESAEGMEFENQPYTASENPPAIVVPSVWKARIAFDDIMTYGSTALKYSELTLSVFEDLGFYKANMDLAEPMAWGYKAGCGLFTKSCIVDGQSTFPSLFCSGGSASHTPCAATVSCNYDYTGIASCKTYSYSYTLPALYQYFSDEKTGGYRPSMDYCPIRADGDIFLCSNSSVETLKGSTFGTGSRCFPSTSLGITIKGESNCKVSAICAHVKCSADNKTYQIQPRHGTWMACPEGQNITISTSAIETSIIQCPAATILCEFDDGTTVLSTTTPVSSQSSSVSSSSLSSSSSSQASSSSSLSSSSSSQASSSSSLSSSSSSQASSSSSLSSSSSSQASSSSSLSSSSSSQVTSSRHGSGSGSSKHQQTVSGTTSGESRGVKIGSSSSTSSDAGSFASAFVALIVGALIFPIIF